MGVWVNIIKINYVKFSKNSCLSYYSNVWRDSTVKETHKTKHLILGMLKISECYSISSMDRQLGIGLFYIQTGRVRDTGPGNGFQTSKPTLMPPSSSCIRLLEANHSNIWDCGNYYHWNHHNKWNCKKMCISS